MGLRTQTNATNDLTEVMSALGDELSALDRALQPPPHFSVRVEGAPRDLATLVREELYWIAREALRNAFQHGRAKGIEVEIRYESSSRRVPSVFGSVGWLRARNRPCSPMPARTCER